MSGVVVCAVAVGIAGQVRAADVAQTLSLGIRDNHELALGAELERVAIADPDIVDVLLLKPGPQRKAGAVLVVGKQAGTTTVSLWTKGEASAKTYVVKVLGELAALQPPPAGATVDVRGGRAVVRGSFSTLAEHENSVIAARDSVGKEGVVLDTSTVASGGVVQVDVKVVEFSKSVMKEAGFNLVSSRDRGFAFGTYSPGRYTGVTSSGGLPAAGAAIGEAFNLVFLNASRSLSVNLSLLETNGLARVLAEPSLVALSGQSASFLSGGELPVPSAGALGTTSVEYKPFGIGLTLTPTVLGRDRIALKVAPEASDIDWANGVTVNGLQIPGISTRRADTTVELGDGESFVIGGLVSRTTVSSLDKVPFLGDLPIIGAFFRGMSYSQNEKELVIIVTPRLVQPLARGAALPLPGELQEKRDSPGNAWGSYLMGISSDDVLPGFSK
ncbi:type II and III secretion system protein family protein [Pigmentiphaga aceris]|uniref:Type II and III secretion system protein family protein n=2 Tax=Pigmentiphaga aceris TaxID=1940612 RepID=A0A5C0B7S0_9BURK|nr:type II and III secretion system protein family protein [Pigmentiphaga aceris]